MVQMLVSQIAGEPPPELHVQIEPLLQIRDSTVGFPNENRCCAALAESVHVAGVSNFLRLAERSGWRTIFSGPALSIEKMFEVVRYENADLLGVAYRLTTETSERLLRRLAEATSELRKPGVRFAFRGIPAVA